MATCRGIQTLDSKERSMYYIYHVAQECAVVCTYDVQPIKTTEDCILHSV